LTGDSDRTSGIRFIDSGSRVDDLHHTNSSTTFARYEYAYDLGSRITQIDSHVDGVSDFTYDNTNQLTDADHSGSGPADEDYDYDANGNRDSSGFDVDPNNQISTDGTYNYTYDDEGNRLTKTLISTGAKEEYSWDHRNRLLSVTFKNNSNAVTKKVDQTYDVWNQWVKRKVDTDGAGSATAVDTYFAYESGQIAFQWEDADGSGGSAPVLAHRYTWAEGVDQFISDEQISTPGSAGNVLWGLGDHLGTERDILDLIASAVSVVNHRDYNSFGSLTSETNSAVDLIIGFTSRPFDEYSWLSNHLNRWLDVWLKQWLSEDPITFAGIDANLRRYVGNQVISSVDPSGNIIVFVDGMLTDLKGRDGTNVGYFVRGLRKAWAEAGAPMQEVVYFNFERAVRRDAYDGMKSPYNQTVGLALMAYVATLKKKCSSEPVYVIGMSNGTNIVTYALEQGMKVDGVIFLGAALDKKHDLTKALTNTPWIASFWSENDTVAKSVSGAGSYGFDTKPKTLGEKKVNDMHHGSGIGAKADKDVAAEKPEKGKTLPFVSYYMGYNYIANGLALKKPPACTSGEKSDPAMRGHTDGLVVHESGKSNPRN